MLPRVDLPAPLGPMMACTSPGFTCSERPLRMSRPPMAAWRLSILSMGVVSRLANGTVGSSRSREPKCDGSCAFRSRLKPLPQDSGSADAAFQAHVQQLLGFHRELHRQLAEDLLAEAVDDQAHRVFLGDATGAAIEHLVVADLGRGGFVLDRGARVLHLDVGEGMRAAL